MRYSCIRTFLLTQKSSLLRALLISVLTKTLQFCGCGVCWTKFETISSKIQMIKRDAAGRKNLSGGMDSPCLGWFPARRRGLGRNAGGFRTGGFRKFGGYKIRNHTLKKSTIFAMLVLWAKKVMTHISILSKVAYYGNYITEHKANTSKTRIDAGRLGEKSQYQIFHTYQNWGWCCYQAECSNNSKNRQVARRSYGRISKIIMTYKKPAKLSKVIQWRLFRRLGEVQAFSRTYTKMALKF